MMKKLPKLLSLFLISYTGLMAGTDYYISSSEGRDSNDGLSAADPMKTLKAASGLDLQPGDRLLFKRGDTFHGTLKLQVTGRDDAPVQVGAYPDKDPAMHLPLPVIDARGYLAPIRITDSRHLEIRDLELKSDAGEPVEAAARESRYGVYMTAETPGQYGGIVLEDLFIHSIYSTDPTPGGGQNPTSNMGKGIMVDMLAEDALIRGVRIEGCRIENTGHLGISIGGYLDDERYPIYLQDLEILNNRFTHIGGPAMVPRVCRNVVVRGNVVDHSGSSFDPRMHNRGSGIWPWTSKDVLIERNQFMHARGKADSCGVHIDFNCSNVVVQYNLSMDNAGGFVEILGNVHNSVYRYNISINDGFRVKGQDGAEQEGKVLWTSGYVGRDQPKHGPYNNYIYNNTVYVKPDIRTCFSIMSTTEGLFVANNVFYILGPTVNVSGDQDSRRDDGRLDVERVLFKNNLYTHADTLPQSLPFSDRSPIFGDPLYVNTEGFQARDFRPAAAGLIIDRSIPIEQLPGDEIGLQIGFEVEHDYFGNPILGKPDLGAVEIGELTTR